MPASWPGSLQQTINVDNFGVTFGDTLIRSDVDVGQAKVRSRYTKGVDVYTAQIDLDYSLYQTFKDFYKTTLNNGALTFEFIDPMTGNLEEWRFMEVPKIVPLGGRIFSVSMTWEMMP